MNEIGRICSTNGREIHTTFWSENVKERDHSEELGVDGGHFKMDLREVACERVN